MRTATLLFALAFIAPAGAQTLQNAFPNLPGNVFLDPVDLQAPDDGSNRLFVVERSGYIRVVANDPAATAATLFLDIDARVTSGGETGLLGLAFDPGYAQNGYFYVNYTAPAPLRTVVSRFRVSATNPNQADPNSEVILIQINQPFSNHNAGQLQFGPDGYLYVALGDGGSGGDPLDNGQNTNTLLGDMLRLDVDGGGLPLDCGAGTGTGTVPADNPFVGQPGYCDEIYASGLRNPWRYSFDAQGRLWVADVGQAEWEEIDLVEAGDNLGWDEFEGNHCYEAPCDPAGKTFPIYEYPHTFNTSGGFAVIGGYVYDGPNCAALLGRYVYGDNVTGNVWSLTYDGSTADNDLVIGLSGKSISTFGRDEQGDLFLADLITDDVFRFSCAQPVSVTATPVNPPVVVGPGGGPFAFDVTLTNTTNQPQTVQAWASADLSNGAEVEAVLTPRTVTLPAGASVTRRVTVNVPALAPSGTNTLVVKVGAFPDGPVSGDAFTVTKQPGVEGTAASILAWDARWTEAAGVAGAAAMASSGTAAELSVSPNPFTEQTTLRYALSAAADVRVEVLDLLGRRVALLADGPAEAGLHTVAWEAGDAPAGVYLVRVTAGASVETHRVTRLR